GIRHLLLRRLQGLEAQLREVLDAAAVEGEQFAADTLADVLHRPKRECLRALQDLEKSHRVLAYREGGYRFEHAHLREVIYGELTPEIRSAHPAGVPASYVRRARPAEQWAARTARHYELGGDPARAAEQWTVAADRAARAHADDQAIELYGRAIESAAGER